MRFEPPDLARLDATEEVVIETAAADGASHRTIIWVVVDGDDAFIRSVNGPGARWYREAIGSGTATVHVGATALESAIEAAADPASVERVSSALARKYAADPALKTMLRPGTLETTLRLVPRTSQG